MDWNAHVVEVHREVQDHVRELWGRAYLVDCVQCAPLSDRMQYLLTELKIEMESWRGPQLLPV